MPETPLYTPSAETVEDSQIAAFAARLKARCGMDWGGDYHSLWQWSVDQPAMFWSELWDWHGIIGSKGETVLVNPDAMHGGQFFPDARLNYAENMLARFDTDSSRPVLIGHHEDGRRQVIDAASLHRMVKRLAGWLQNAGVNPGDRVAAYVPNIPEAVITMLATASIGAVFSSCSTDFGLAGVTDRFSQISPKVLLTVDGYRYAGKLIDRREVVTEVMRQLPSVEQLLIIPYLRTETTPDCSGWRAGLPPHCLFDEALQAPPIDSFIRRKFNDPLYILYSSGTTGAPKCITHGIGGTLIQHIKEMRLHCGVREGEAIFYFTTCGWMMWNWLVSGLSVGASIVLYEGNPFHPGPERLWQMAADEAICMFGTSAKYIDAVRKSGYHPRQAVSLPALRLLCSTGSPLSVDGFSFVYEQIKSDLQLASISGGTDLISCFALGVPVLPVYRGEIQCRGLGMATAVWNEEGRPVTDEPGELVCTKPFPSMPIGFWGDADGSRYRAAYFEHFPGIWRHGDWATLTGRGGMIIHGRSDATLNPGGVRIGTAELYRQVEAFDAITEALVIGQQISQDGMDDVRVVLFVRLAEGVVLDDALKAALRQAIREGASPRHVPAVILEIADIPRTRSGKISELAVRDVVHGRPVKNTEALANPEALELFRNHPQLAV